MLKQLLPILTGPRCECSVLSVQSHAKPCKVSPALLGGQTRPLPAPKPNNSLEITMGPARWERVPFTQERPDLKRLKVPINLQTAPLRSALFLNNRCSLPAYNLATVPLWTLTGWRLSLHTGLSLETLACCGGFAKLYLCIYFLFLLFKCQHCSNRHTDTLLWWHTLPPTPYIMHYIGVRACTS